MGDKGARRGAGGAAIRLSVALLMTTLPLLTGACAFRPPRPELFAADPVFSPQAFFTGATVGDGLLRIGLARARTIHVESSGHGEADGTLVLVQRIEQVGRPPHSRTWRLRSVDDTHLSGTLSDASGPVQADVRGNMLHVRFAGKGGLMVEQWMFLQPGGQIALNRMVLRKFGLPVATLGETIRRRP